MDFKILPINNLSEDDLFNFLSLIDNDIIPPISKRIDLKKYAEKIRNLSLGKVAIINDEIIGLTVYYPPNTKDGYIYLTLLAVNRMYRGKNIGRELINEMIKTGKEMKARGIKLQTWITASRLISYYKTYGFQIYGFSDNRGNKVKSVFLKQEF